MDFFAMKRKKLQTLCKKHGIPANLKNKEMAEKLSFIYNNKGKENENPVPCKLQSNENVEIIDLDSNSEASDVVAEKDCNEKTNVNDEHFLDEVHSSGLKYSVGEDQSLPTCPLTEAKSGEIHHMVDSGNAAGDIDDCEVKTTSSKKMSRGREELQMELPSEKTDNDGSFYVEENMQMGVNKEQIDDNQELHPDEPSGDVNVPSEELGNDMVEEEVEILSEKTDVYEEFGTTEVGDEAEKLDQINSHQGSIKKCANLLHVSPKESFDCSVEEVSKLNDNICVTSEAATMCLDASTGAENTYKNICVTSEAASDTVDEKDCNEKTNVTDEHFLDEVHSSGLKHSVQEGDQSLTTCPLSEVKPSDLNIHHMVDSDTAAEDVEACAVKFASSTKMSGGQEESEMKLPTERRDSVGSLHVEENMQMSVNEEQIDENQELHPAEPSEDVNVASGEFGNDTAEEEVEILSEKTDIHEEFGTNEVGDGTEKLDQSNSRQGSIKKCTNLLHVSQMETSDTVAEKDCNEKTNVTDEHFLDEVHSSGLKHEVREPDQSLHTSPLREVKGIDLVTQISEDSDGVPAQLLPEPFTDEDISYFQAHEIIVAGTAMKNADTGEVKFVSSPKISTSSVSDKMIGSSTKLLSSSVTPRDIGFSEVEENMQIGINKELVDHVQKKIIDFSPKWPNNSGTPTDEDIELCDVEENLQIGANKENPSEEIFHAEQSVVVMNDNEDLTQVISEELGNDLMEEEVVNTDDKIDLVQNVCGIGNNSDEAGNQNGINSPEGSNINNISFLHVFPGESSSHLVGEVQKSDDNVMYDGVDDLENFEFGVDVLYSHEKTMAAEDTDAKTNVSREDLPYESLSPSVKYSDDEHLVPVASEEFGNKLVEGEFEKLNGETDLEDFCVTAKGKDEALKPSGINSPLGSNMNDVNLLHASPLVGEVQKSDDIIMHSGSGVDGLCSLDKSIAAKDTDGKINVTMQHFPYEDHSSSVKYSDGSQDQIMTTGPQIELISSSDLNIHQIVDFGTGDKMQKSSEKTKESIGFSSNEDVMEASATKGFEAETYFDPTTLGDVMETCNMEESLQIDMMEKETNQEDSILAQGEVNKFFDNNSDVPNDVGGIGVEEDENQSYMASHKRKRSDVNSEEEKDEFVPTIPQPSDIESSNFTLHQLFALDTVSGDEGTCYQEKLDSPSKSTQIASGEKNAIFSPKLHESSMRNKELEIEMNLPLKPARDSIGTCDMKENMKIDKKEEVGSMISRNKFAKRQPLQDLQQN